MSLSSLLRAKDPRKRHFLLATLSVFLTVLAFSPSFATQDPSAAPGSPSKIAVSVDLVLVPVKVTDANGAFVTGLQLDNFRVFENGQLQQLTVFDEGDTPVTVGLVVDHSRSMRPKLRDVVLAVSSFAHSSNSQDEMFVVDFNDDVSIELMKGKAFSNNSKELEQAVNAVSARGRTALYDAVGEGLNHLQYGHLGKKALIIISDGGDNASHLKFSDVLARAHQSQALIYSIALTGSSEAEENPGLLRRLCKATGGIAYFPSEGESVANISREIARDLREQYTLGYVPHGAQGSEAFRKLEVKVNAPGKGRLRIRTRQGYSLAGAVQPTLQRSPGIK